MKLTIKKVLFPNKNKPSPTGFTIAKAIIKSHGTECPEAMKDGKDLYNEEITVKGKHLNFPGKLLDVEGSWTEDKFGISFSVKSSLNETNTEDKAQPIPQSYTIEILAKIIGGIGILPAKKIVDALGDNALYKLDEDPSLIFTVPDISDRKKGEIKKAYIQQRVKALRIKELKDMGISARKAEAMFDIAGEKTMEVLKAAPYSFASRLGFEAVEEIISGNGIKADFKSKAKAFMLHILQEYEKAGHCCMPFPTWLKEASDYLKTDNGVIGDIAKEMFSDKTAVLSTVDNKNYYIFRKQTYIAEQNTAKDLIRILRSGTSNIENADEDIELMEKKAGFKIAPEQREAVKVALKNSVAVITGGPGTGKSTIIDFIRSIYSKRFNGNILMFAPTGKAARRMQETTGCSATTVHRGLKLKVNDLGEFYGPAKINADFIIVDEFSMTDIFLANMLFKSIKDGTKLLIVGDVDQLPSVGAGSVLQDIIESGAIPTVKLTKVYRQAGESSIAINAFLMKNGNYDFEDDDSYHLIVKDDFKSAAEEIDKIYLEEIKRVGLDNVVFLSPYRKTAAETSVNSFNQRIHDKVNPPSSDKMEISIKDKIFRVGDRVMQTTNTDFVSNGEVGYIKGIKDKSLILDFGNGDITYDRYQADAYIDLAYATTVHKSQGSEYKVVIFNIQNEHGVMLKRNLLYTAITRAKEKVIIVGSKKALVTAVKCSNEREKRLTMLAYRLSQKVSKKFF